MLFARDMEAVDYLLLRGEHDPRSRAAMVSVAMLDVVPEFARLRVAVDRASRIVLRLRQHVVAPTLPIAAPQWVVDPDFDLDFHLRRVALPAPGTTRQLLDFLQPLISDPFDTARPLWELTLVEGVTEGDAPAALVMKLHHAVTDGVGGIELFKQLYDFERDTPRGPMPALPVPEDVSPADLTSRAAHRLPIALLGAAGATAGHALRLLERTIRSPDDALGDLVREIRSAQRVLGPPPAPPSPLLRGRGLGRRLEVLEVPLDTLRRAAKAAGGSVNDAYISAICGALRLYHEALGVPVDAVPLALPVSLRTDDDPAGGNRFAGARIAAPVGEPDPAVRIRTVRHLVLTAVDEPAVDVLRSLAPVLARLPAPVLSSLSALIATTDVQASNIPGYPEAPYIAGAKVLKTHPFGPLPGVPMMVVLLTQAGTCFVGVQYDTAAVTEQDLFARSLAAGFDEVLTLAADAHHRTRSTRTRAGA